MNTVRRWAMRYRTGMGASVLQRTVLEGRWCRLEPLDPERHAADLFDAYAQADDERDWTWLASRRPDSVAATFHWLSGKANDDALVPFTECGYPRRNVGGVSLLYGDEREHGALKSAMSPVAADEK